MKLNQTLKTMFNEGEEGGRHPLSHDTISNFAEIFRCKQTNKQADGQ